MPEHTVHLTVNCSDHTVTAPARTTLADLLRDYLDLTGTHLGCEQGVCGACTVLLDDLPVRACLVLAVACEGSEVTTIEGLDGPDADRLRTAFSREGGLQCGFCTSGMLLASYDLVRRRQVLTREELCVALAGNICRCTGYNGIVRAVQAAVSEGIESELAPDTQQG
jgi:carbon-monoxide dehydrogenase small subunit